MSIIVEKNQRLRAEILKHLYYHKSLSINALSKFAQRSIPLVTSAVTSLIAEGYIIEKGLAPSTGGRRPATFLLNPDQKKYIVAVAMDQFITRISVFDLGGRVVFRGEKLSLNISDAQLGLNQLTEFIKSSLKASAIAHGDFLGIGLGMPGFTDAVKGINYTFLQPGDGSTLQEYLTRQLSLPVFIENDSYLVALAELKFGIAMGLKDVLVVNIGWGTGLGMIINGQLYRGSSGFAGEFSHIPLSDSNNLCSCGKRGCLEVNTSLKVMAERAEQALAEGAESSMKTLFRDDSKLAGEHFLDAAAQYDPLAISILSKSAFDLGKGLATLIHIMNPECIVLSGRGAKAGKALLPSIELAVNEFSIPRIAEQTKIKLSRLTDEAELLGAASLVVEHIEL
ncbi:ROK family protein [Pedobacter aquatilis]|uniref:ROK family protein n=1 Tax=Pedobacter aquatilis TaxID=351343 RepID=UPI0029315726|nr:ROK family protein [Pedobacter aquatilis]